MYAKAYVLRKEPYPSFVDWVRKDYDDKLKVHSMEVENRYRSHDFFESVDIINMHDGAAYL